jgi:hypothetical protein
MTTLSSRPALRESLLGPLAVGLAGLAAGTLIYIRDPHQSGSYGYCPFLLISGHPCPGCGGLRAGHDLLHGDVAAAISSNALVVAAAITLGVLWIGWLGRRWRGRPGGMVKLSERTAWLLLAVAVVFGIVRNTPWGSWLAP